MSCLPWKKSAKNADDTETDGSEDPEGPKDQNKLSELKRPKQYLTIIETIGNYGRIDVVLGQGKYATVYLGTDLATRNCVAIKRESIAKEFRETNARLHDVYKEIELQKQLRECINIVKLIEVVEKDFSVNMVLEHMGENLYDALKLQPNKRFNEHLAAVYTKDITQAVIYCHSKGIMHRDIKLDNILLDETGAHVKLSDFGFAVMMGEHTDTVVGTMDYLAPELVLGKKHNSAVDLWCVGVCIYEMITGVAPFYANTNERTYERILKVDLKFPRFVSHSAAELIGKVLKKNPTHRLALENIILHPFIGQVK